MKTAEEWCDETAVNGDPSDVPTWWIKQIQLDAMKEGAKRAAQLVKDKGVSFFAIVDEALQQKKDTILYTADNWTLKDL